LKPQYSDLETILIILNIYKIQLVGWDNLVVPTYRPQ